MSAMSTSIIVAVSANGVIGRDGGLPWHLPSDLKHFKALTLGKPVIMGRKTFASIGRPLPGRPNIVISRKADFKANGVIVVASLEAALQTGREQAAMLGVNDICIIGGGEIYRQAMDFADVLHITKVAVEVDGDTTFPVIDASIFEEIANAVLPQGEKDSHAMQSVTYRRKNPAK
ncbi:dihydrofolate reductase [Pararhizobium antarcticum]|uniref:Dihydrofolate reductase n=1 Tax=Pararhizobium antarcticum TaxID=1798805 RepID=A0A657LSK4_9HYPH|nr:dihydrofolate reductase [Pararhizobium antarcticum]OJF92016.1 diacylglycerol kinase [Rhizobium sp. 58]OJF96031.1 diacylglycerol kinase [Pararhizobium antarcticum]